MKPAHGPRRCTATTRRGLPCRAWAVPDTNPPTCAAHRATPRPGAPIGNTNALKHGGYASTAHQPGAGLQPIIADLSTRIQRLGNYIDHEELDTKAYLDALDLLGLLSTRLARVMREHRALEGQGRTDLENAINDALDIVASTLGTVL